MNKILIIFLLCISGLTNAQYQVNSNIVIANKDGYTYTEGHFQKSLRFVEFLIGQPMLNADKQYMKQESLKNFEQNPQAIINEVNNIDQQMQQLYQLTDIYQIANVRSALISQIYINSRQQPQNQSFIVQVLNKYVPLLAIDTQNLLAFTYKDFEGYVLMMQFNAGLLGENLQLSQEQLLQIKNTLTQQFYSMSLEQKRSLCSMQLLYEYMSKAYQQMTPQQKQQLQAQMLNQYYASYNQQQNQTTQNQANNYSVKWPAGVTTKAQKQAYIRKRQREYSGNQAAMNTYYNSMMSNHATMLNVFSNYDSNTYWQYKY